MLENCWLECKTNPHSSCLSWYTQSPEQGRQRWSVEPQDWSQGAWLLEGRDKRVDKWWISRILCSDTMFLMDSALLKHEHLSCPFPCSLDFYSIIWWVIAATLSNCGDRHRHQHRQSLYIGSEITLSKYHQNFLLHESHLEYR